MIEHISLRTKNLKKSKEFYEAALRPLGYKVVVEFPGAVGMGVKGKTDFWLVAKKQTVEPTHFAFSALSRKAVDQFHKAALKAGGKDNGAPGIRGKYHKNYYGAFILDFAGNNVEAVCQRGR